MRAVMNNFPAAVTFKMKPERWERVGWTRGLVQRGALHRENTLYRGSPRWEELKGQRGWSLLGRGRRRERAEQGRQSGA